MKRAKYGEGTAAKNEKRKTNSHSMFDDEKKRQLFHLNADEY